MLWCRGVNRHNHFGGQFGSSFRDKNARAIHRLWFCPREINPQREARTCMLTAAVNGKQLEMAIVGGMLQK